MTYPKIYATYLGMFNTFQKEVYWGQFAANYPRQYRFRLDTGEIVESHHFSRSGHTPKRLRQAWHETVAKYGYRKALVVYNIMPEGTRVKMYKKNGTWYYRHLGQ